MTYVEEARQRLSRALAGVGEVPPALLDLYALLVFTRGWQVTNEDVHDAWSLWRSRSDPEHRSIVPYSELTYEVQNMDTPYADAIAKVALSMRGELDGRYTE